MRAYVDANIIFLAWYSTDERGAKAARAMQRIQEGQDAGFTCSLTVDEVMWCIIKQKRGQDLRKVVERIYGTPNFYVLDTPANAPRLALEFMEEYGLKPRDAIHAAVMREHQIDVIYSDDADFDRVKGIKRFF